MNEQIEQIFKPLSEEDAKDLIIAKLFDDIEITERWIREHVNEEWHANHRALLIVADCLKDVRTSYTIESIIKRYNDLSNLASSARICFNDYETRGEIDPILLSMARMSLSEL